MQHGNRHMAMSMAQYGMGFLLSLQAASKGSEVSSSYFFTKGKNSIFCLINICLNSSFDSLYFLPRNDIAYQLLLSFFFSDGNMQHSFYEGSQAADSTFIFLFIDL